MRSCPCCNSLPGWLLEKVLVTDTSERTGFDSCKRWFEGSKKVWAEIISSNFCHLYVFSLHEFLASLCLQEAAVCFGCTHFFAVSSWWDSWISGQLWVGSLLHFKWHQMFLSMVDNWTFLIKACPLALGISFSVGWGKVVSPYGPCILIPTLEETSSCWLGLDDLTLLFLFLHLSSCWR